MSDPLDPILPHNPQKLAVEIQRELEPFLMSFDTLEINRKKVQQFKKNYQSFKARYCKAKKVEEFVMEGILHDVWRDPDEWETSNFIFSGMFAYLGLIETVANCVIDILVMLLVVNGREFHVRSDNSSHIKHASSISSITDGKVDLAIKLDFLKENGIKFFANIIDTKLRNDIAHVNYQIIENPDEDDEWVKFKTRLKDGKLFKATAKQLLLPRFIDLLEGVEIVVNTLSLSFDEKTC